MSRFILEPLEGRRFGKLILSNVVTACGQCNKAKRITPVEDFRSWVCRVYHHWAKMQDGPTMRITERTISPSAP